MREEISLYFYSFSDFVVGRENQDQLLDGGGLMDMSQRVNKCCHGYD